MDQRKNLDPAPIALFVYNRPDHTRRTVEALQKNDLASATELFVFCDGAKNSGAQNVQQVRDYVKNISGFKKVTVEESTRNKGLANSIIDGVTKIVNQFGKIIVVEDDLLTSPHFLQFMNDGLSRYEHEEKIISIHGYVYPVKGKLPETFFLRGADCWGWATWKRGWDLFEPDGKKLLAELEQKNLTEKFDFDGCYAYTQMLRDQIDGKNNSWAIRWYASAFLAEKLTLYPGMALVQNIGHDGSGTHCGKSSSYQIDATSDTKIELGTIAIQENSSAKNMIKKFLKPKKGLIYRIAKKIEKKQLKKERRKYGWFSTELSWQEILRQHGGYDKNEILEKCKNALLRVKNGEAIHERDSVLLDEIEYSWPVLSALMWIAAQNAGKLSVLDFGGSLGSSFFQNRKFLAGLKEVKWSVVEQENFVNCGKEFFADDSLKFYRDIESCLQEQQPHVMLISSTLQYLEFPHQFLEKLQQFGFEYLVFDSTGMVEDADFEDMLTIQKVPPEIYQASYPCWIFNRKKIFDSLNKKYDLLAEFDSYVGKNVRVDNKLVVPYKGAIFRLKNDN